MHDGALRTTALELVAAGVNDCEIARRLGIPRTTVRDWRHPRYARAALPVACERCWKPMRRVAFTPDDYAELLGLYLGDGHISAGPRTQRLRLSLDAAYSNIVKETAALLARCFPGNRSGHVLADAGSTVVLRVYHQHLACLLPQHGEGKKHDRRIVLEPWQRQIVASAPWAFLRGCIRSDGCVFVNRTGPYSYVSYDFRNLSPDIRELFAATCRLVGVECRTYARRVRIYRRPSVELMLEHVGTKS